MIITDKSGHSALVIDTLTVNEPFTAEIVTVREGGDFGIEITSQSLLPMKLGKYNSEKNAKAALSMFLTAIKDNQTMFTFPSESELSSLESDTK